ncbi:MAG: hypothetical protein ACXV2G_06575 [Actinomycetes bacterium]
MTTTTARPSPTVSGPIADRGRRRVRLLAFLLLGLALLTVAGVIAWNSLQSPPQPAGTTSFDPGSTYAPGGSVYDEQVPQAAS